MSMTEIMGEVQSHGVGRVTVTGGEPLAQRGVLALMDTLVSEGYEVSIETSGAHLISGINPHVSVVMDLKTPGSGESHRNLMDNIPLLKRSDQVKFVITDREDYDWSRFQVDALALNERVDDILFSPSFEQLDPVDLASWILADRLPVRMQLQLHKLLWGDQPGV